MGRAMGSNFISICRDFITDFVSESLDKAA
jgi:hypothetical protein